MSRRDRSHWLPWVLIALGLAAGFALAYVLYVIGERVVP